MVIDRLRIVILLSRHCGACIRSGDRIRCIADREYVQESIGSGRRERCATGAASINERSIVERDRERDREDPDDTENRSGLNDIDPDTREFPDQRAHLRFEERDFRFERIRLVMPLALIVLPCFRFDADPEFAEEDRLVCAEKVVRPGLLGPVDLREISRGSREQLEDLRDDSTV